MCLLALEPSNTKKYAPKQHRLRHPKICFPSKFSEILLVAEVVGHQSLLSYTVLLICVKNVLINQCDLIYLPLSG